MRLTAPASREALCSLLRESERESILWILAVLYIPGFILAGLSTRLPEPSWSMSTAVVLCLAVSVALLVRDRSYLVAAWTLVLGCILADLLAVGAMGVPSALALLALPVGLAALAISTLVGTLTAMSCSVLVLYPPVWQLEAPPELQIVTLTGLWGILGLIWLSRLPLLTAFDWMWSSTEQNLRLLDEARDQRLQLEQVLADLADANLQLTRLNSLTQGLRQVAEEARQAKEQFVANVSHELRTPLNMIIGFSEMILQAPQAYGRHISPVLLADLAVILRNSQHLSNLIDDVLDLSQIDTGRMALTKERTAIAELIETAATAVRPLYQSKGLGLTIYVAPELPRVMCDPTRIREVVLNLLSNAGRFTERGGVDVQAWREGDQVLVSVQDTGPGIAAQDVDRIFHPFEQLDASLRRRHGGSGLGLSISKGFVELHSGRMWLKSEVGVGTTFFLSLPIDPPLEAHEGALRWLNPEWLDRSRTRRSLAPIPTVRPRFVVVEASDALTRLLRRYLDGVEVVQVSDLDGATRELARAPAQGLLINDVSIQTALRRLSVQASLPPGTPVIVCSVPGVRQAASALGAVEYLVKPVSRDALLDVLERLSPPTTATRTVLLVEDDPEALQLFWRMVVSAGRGYRVVPATNGQQALDIVRDERPDVILLDLIMPEMDGFAFLEARIEDPALRDVPVVVISARDPVGQPIVAKALAVTQSGGLSVPQLLGCIEGLSRLLSPITQPVGPAQPGTPPG